MDGFPFHLPSSPAWPSTRHTLDGSHSYRIHFPAGDIPPVKYYWSLTIYNLQTELIANPYNKYSVGSNKGIKYNKDGSLDVYIQQVPAAGHEANWLPAPPNTPFLIAMRLYGPKRSVLNGTYRYPTIQRVS